MKKDYDKTDEFFGQLKNENSARFGKKKHTIPLNHEFGDAPPSYSDVFQSHNHNGAASSSVSQQHNFFNQRQTKQQPQNDMIDGENSVSVYKKNKTKFGNPLAHNETWSPTGEDYALLTLPKIDYMLRVKSHLSRRAGNPFDVPPVSFSRTVPPTISRDQMSGFRPVILKSESKLGLIGGGFKPAYPGRIFAPLDVSAADFSRLLEDIVTAGKLSAKAHIVANTVPICMDMALASSSVVKAVTRALLRRSEPLVIETIETWQERFFAPRGIDMFVVFDGERVTASYPGGIPGPLSSEIAALVGKHQSLQQQHDLDNNSYDFDNSSESDSDESLDSLKPHRKREKEERKARAIRQRKGKRAHRNSARHLEKVPLLIFVPLVHRNAS